MGSDNSSWSVQWLQELLYSRIIAWVVREHIVSPYKLKSRTELGKADGPVTRWDEASLIENTGNKGMSQDNMSIDMTWNRHVVMLLEIWSGRKYEKAKSQYELMSRSLLNSRSHLTADSESWAICWWLSHTEKQTMKYIHNTQDYRYL